MSDEVEAKLNAIRERLSAATPGPWSYTDGDVIARTLPITVCEEGFGEWKYDGRFIANAPTDIALLLELVEVLQGDLKYSREQSQGRWDKGEILKQHNCELMEENKNLSDRLNSACQCDTCRYEMPEADKIIAAQRVALIKAKTFMNEAWDGKQNSWKFRPGWDEANDAIMEALKC